MNHKVKRITAIIGVILLAGMYLATLIFSLIGSDFAKNMLLFSIFGTFFIPVVIYAMTLMFRITSRKDNDPPEES